MKMQQLKSITNQIWSTAVNIVFKRYHYIKKYLNLAEFYYDLDKFSKLEPRKEKPKEKKMNLYDNPTNLICDTNAYTNWSEKEEEEADISSILTLEGGEESKRRKRIKNINSKQTIN